jgi:hypothetical protein
MQENCSGLLKLRVISIKDMGFEKEKVELLTEFQDIAPFPVASQTRSTPLFLRTNNLCFLVLARVSTGLIAAQKFSAIIVRLATSSVVEKKPGATTAQLGATKPELSELATDAMVVAAQYKFAKPQQY